MEHHVLLVAEEVSPVHASLCFRSITAVIADVVVAVIGVASEVSIRCLELAPTDVATETLTASHVALFGFSREWCILKCHPTASIAPEIFLVLRLAVWTVALGSSSLSLSPANRAIAWAFRFALLYR